MDALRVRAGERRGPGSFHLVGIPAHEDVFPNNAGLCMTNQDYSRGPIGSCVEIVSGGAGGEPVEYNGCRANAVGCRAMQGRSLRTRVFSVDVQPRLFVDDLASATRLAGKMKCARRRRSPSGTGLTPSAITTAMNFSVRLVTRASR